jgi:beta-lactam-binding protein with PASTA domain
LAQPSDRDEARDPGMKLGSSIRRRRSRGNGGFKWPALGRWVGIRQFKLPRGVALAAGVVLVLGIGVGYLVTTRVLFPLPPPPGDLFEVPDVRGLDRSAALEMIEGAGMVAAVTDSFRHPIALNGEVLGQTPIAGQLSVATGTVALTVSLGPVRRPVPDVTRLGLNSARTVLEASGFVVVVDTLLAELPEGQVVEVLPEAGTEVALPMEVIVYVSTGPPLIPMPRLLGIDQASAEILLDSLEFELMPIETCFRFGRDQGLILNQFPTPDSLVSPGSRVRLAVGSRRSSGRGCSSLEF